MGVKPVDLEQGDLQDTVFAGLDRRVGAFFLDLLIVYFAVGLIQIVVYLLSGGFPLNRLKSGLSIEFWFLLTFSLPLWLYFILLESSSRRATVGKRILKLQVTDLDRDRINLFRAFIRTLIKILPWELLFVALLLPEPIFLDPASIARPAMFLVYFLLGIYMIAMIASPRKRGIHDLLAGTLVLNELAEREEGDRLRG
jgi:uncharacterized RDD family membrane protein YckC